MGIIWYETDEERRRRLKEDTGYPDGKPLKKSVLQLQIQVSEDSSERRVGRPPRWGQ